MKLQSWVYAEAALRSLTAVMSLIGAVLTVLLIITHPHVRNTLAITQTLEMAFIARYLSCGNTHGTF